MTKRRLDSYIDALADGKRPDSFDADPEDIEMLRAAISLRAARPGDTLPDDGFVDRLYQELAGQGDHRVVPLARQGKVRRRRTAIAAIAAGLVLVGGTAAVTEAVAVAVGRRWSGTGRSVVERRGVRRDLPHRQDSAGPGE